MNTHSNQHGLPVNTEKPILTGGLFGFQGFTLIEILMVIALVGIISAVVVPNFVSFQTDAKTTVTRNRINEIKTAIIGDSSLKANGTFLKPGFVINVGSVPTSLTQLTAQGALAAYDPFTKRGWRGPYVSTQESNWNRDAWGTLLVYDSAARTIRSCGKNLTCGDGDDITVTF